MSKTVIYKITEALPCDCESAVIICVDSSLTASGAPFIEGTFDAVITEVGACNSVIYASYLTYDENLLLNPAYSLLNSDINGVICKGCLTDYIEYLVAHAGIPT